MSAATKKKIKTAGKRKQVPAVADNYTILLKDKNWLTVEEVVEITHICSRTIRDKIKLGLLPTYKPGKRRLINAKDLELFIRRHKAS